MMYYLIDYENVYSDGFKVMASIQKNDKVIVFYSEQRKNISFDMLGQLKEMGIEPELIKASVGTKNALDFQLSSYLGYLIGTNKAKAPGTFLKLFSDQSSITEYCIVSNDKGFDCLCEYWRSQKVIVIRKGTNELSPVSETPARRTKNRAGRPAAGQRTVAGTSGKTAAIKKNTAEKPAATKKNTTEKTPAVQNRAAEKPAAVREKAPEGIEIATMDEVMRYIGSEDAPQVVLAAVNRYKTKMAICNAIQKELKDAERTGDIYRKLKPLLKEKKKS